MRGDFAHVGIAGGKSPGMLDLDVIAMAAMTTRIDDLAVSHRVNGRAIARTDINACMHSAITQYGMPAQSIRRGLPSGDGCHHLSAWPAHAGRLQPLSPSCCGPFSPIDVFLFSAPNPS